jgi:hypothetical protein
MDANVSRHIRTGRKIGQDDREVINLRNYGVGLVGGTLPTTRRMNVDVCNYRQPRLPTDFPKVSEFATVYDHNSRIQCPGVDIVVKYETTNPRWMPTSTQQEGTTFSAAAECPARKLLSALEPCFSVTN